MKNLKSIIPILLLVLGLPLVIFCGCKKQADNLVCCVENPLTDLEWLKNYCENVQEQDILSINIDLYRVVGKNEHVFKISSSFPFESTPEQGNIGYLTEWRNCTGELVFHVLYPATPPNPITVDIFMKDKEFISELFNFVKQ